MKIGKKNTIEVLKSSGANQLSWVYPALSAVNDGSIKDFTRGEIYRYDMSQVSLRVTVSRNEYP